MGLEYCGFKNYPEPEPESRFRVGKKGGSGSVRKKSPKTGTVKLSDKYEMFLRNSNYLIHDNKDT
jgi:hypothetical protein